MQHQSVQFKTKYAQCQRDTPRFYSTLMDPGSVDKTSFFCSCFSINNTNHLVIVIFQKAIFTVFI